MDNRNIYGFALFTLIIISTVFVKLAFFTPKPVIVSPPIYKKTECFSMRKSTAPGVEKVQQATLNLQTGVFNFDMDLTEQLDFNTEKGFAVALNFYTKDPQPRLIATEMQWIKPHSVYYKQSTNGHMTKLTMKGLIEKNCARYWVSGLDSNQSVYVVPRVASSTRKAITLSTEFNEAKAIPVLLFAGK